MQGVLDNVLNRLPFGTSSIFCSLLAVVDESLRPGTGAVEGRDHERMRRRVGALGQVALSVVP